jgi:hypothetical protein
MTERIMILDLRSHPPSRSAQTRRQAGGSEMAGLAFFLSSSANWREPPHVHAKKGRQEAKFRLSDCTVAAVRRVPQHELSARQRQVRDIGMLFWRNGMRISDDELEAMEPVNAACTDAELIVTLANGQKVVTPLRWYPRLLNATPSQRANLELSPLGVHWPEIDEDLSVQGMLVGSKARGARQPEPA